MIKKLLISIGSILSLVFNFLIFQKLKSIKMYLYTGYLKGNFSHFGSGSKIIPSIALLVGAKYIYIGNNCLLGRHIQLTAYDKFNNIQTFTPLIVIGDGSNIGDFSHITSINKIKIGKNVLMGRNVLITDNSHGTFSREQLSLPPIKRPLFSKGPVVIEDDVWIGEKVSIMANVRVGRGSIIAANSVITTDIPPYSLVAGCPAIVKKSIDIESNL